MSASGTLAMRRRLPGAGVGQDMEPSYGLATPRETVDKALSVNAFIQAVNRDFASHASVIDANFMEAWKAFYQTWTVQIQQLRSAGMELWLPSTMEMLIEKETLARRFRNSYEQRTGLRSAVPDMIHRQSLGDTMRNVRDQLAPFAIPTAAIVAIVAVVGGVLVFKTMK